MDILILVGLILMNGVFAMSEMAIVSARKARLSARADRGNKGARKAMGLQDDPSSFLSTVQIGITLVGIVAGAYGATALADDLAPVIATTFPALSEPAPQIAFGVVIVLTTFLSLVVGELVPKRVALLAPEAIASVIAGPMIWLSRLASPAVWLLRQATNALIALLGLRNTPQQEVTEEEIHALIDEGASSGAVDAREQKLIRGVFRLGDRSVTSIMTPRRDMVALDTRKPWSEIRQIIASSGHSRFVLTDGGLDQIIGIVQTKDMLAAMRDDGTIDLRSVAHSPTFVPETLSAMQLLEQLKACEVRLALVIDEHGEVQGLVTAADIFSAIAGAEALSPADGLTPPVQRPDGSWLVDGKTAIEDLETLLGGLQLGEREGGFSTLGGLVMHELGRLGQVGDRVKVGNTQFEVMDIDGRRIDMVLVTPARSDDG